MTIKYNRFALFPHTCSECGKSFWLEPYKHFKMDEYKVFGCITYITNICKECSNKIENKDKMLLNNIEQEIEQIGAIEQETNGKTDYLKGITTCLTIIDKYKAESEVENAGSN